MCGWRTRHRVRSGAQEQSLFKSGFREICAHIYHPGVCCRLWRDCCYKPVSTFKPCLVCWCSTTLLNEWVGGPRYQCGGTAGNATRRWILHLREHPLVRWVLKVDSTHSRSLRVVLMRLVSMNTVYCTVDIHLSHWLHEMTVSWGLELRTVITQKNNKKKNLWNFMSNLHWNAGNSF